MITATAAIVAVGLAIYCWPPAREFAQSFFLPKLKIVILGDSITAGQGDDEGDYREFGALNGFVKRAQNILTDCEITPVAYPGKDSVEIFKLAQEEMERNSELKNTFEEAQLVIMAGGINDFWNKNFPRTSVLGLRKISNDLRKISPHALVSVASFILPLDKYHHRWALEANLFLLSKSFRNLQPGPRFEGLPPSDFSEDALHPTPKGYDYLASQLVIYICQVAKEGAFGGRMPRHCIAG